MEFLRRLLPHKRKTPEASVKEVIEVKPRILYTPPLEARVPESDIISEFIKNGYQICPMPVGKSIRISPEGRNLGYLADDRFLNVNLLYEIFHSIPGLEQPKGYKFSDILKLPGPFVAKDMRKDRGEYVFYLEGREAIAKFLAWNYAFSRDANVNKDIYAQREKIMNAVSAINKKNGAGRVLPIWNPQKNGGLRSILRLPVNFIRPLGY